ncbi:MAG: papain-like cysteine protease family protein [bacterium]
MRRHKTTLLELERKVQNKPNGAKRVLARAYDSGVSIELCYDSSYWRPRSIDSNIYGRPAGSQSFGWSDEVAAYTVESFETENPDEPIAADDSVSRKTTKEEFDEKSSAPDEATRYELQERRSDDNEQTANGKESEPGSGAASTSEASSFVRDLQAIAAEQMQRSQQAAKTAPTAREEEPPPNHPHAIFDRMGKNMSYATTFDLGTLELKNRFNEFDRQLDASEKRTPPRKMIEAFAGPVELNDLDFAEDFAAMSMAANKGGGVPSGEISGQTPFSTKGAATKVSGAAPTKSFPGKGAGTTTPEQSAPAPTKGSPQQDSGAPPRTPQRGNPPAQGSPAINVTYNVPLVPQQTGMSCWAAGAAMLVGWRDQISIDPSEIPRATGYWQQYQNGLSPEDTGMFAAWGLVPEPAQTHSIEGFKNLLERYGALWVASAEPGPHIRVVTGLTGDGTPDGTTVHLNDPWERGMSQFRMPNAGAQYTETYRQFEQKQATLARRESNVQGIYVAHLPQRPAFIQ